jgi:6-pyruvoyltetrahydropterin/6-carboxytetrahydropterin synthase
MFEASHQLPFHDGKCARLHGHSWKMTVTFRGSQLETDGPKRGMLADYYDIGTACRRLVDGHLDHTHLNDLLPNPTSENISRWCHEWLVDNLLPKLADMLHSVEIGETCTTGCVYINERTTR